MSINWTQYQQMFESNHKRVDALVDKLCKEPMNKDARIWIQAILDSGLYDSDDINYLLKFHRKPFNNT